ncbi:MAG: hypothetical protein IPK99_13790 [Flavobacteriales bacterium]|nr:hypothetical protein [Flavobacteriales bacterium]
MPMVIQRIALISSVGTAAYEDFMQHLSQNEHGYTFHVRVFSSSCRAMVLPVTCAVRWAVSTRAFDAVVLIRGGGSKLDLEPFNDLELCPHGRAHAHTGDDRHRT